MVWCAAGGKGTSRGGGAPVQRTKGRGYSVFLSGARVWGQIGALDLARVSRVIWSVVHGVRGGIGETVSCTWAPGPTRPSGEQLCVRTLPSKIDD